MNRKKSIEINFSKGEPNSEFELTSPCIVAIKYRIKHFYSDGHQSCDVRLGNIWKLGLVWLVFQTTNIRSYYKF